MIDGQELYNELRHYTGGDKVYFHSLVKSFHYTAGVREFAQKAGSGAYWLLDFIATEPKIIRHVAEMGFALVCLTVVKNKALLTVANDSGVEPFFTKKAEYTDCPEAPVTPSNPAGIWKFYIEQTMVGDKVVPIMMLPQER